MNWLIIVIITSIIAIVSVPTVLFVKNALIFCVAYVCGIASVILSVCIGVPLYVVKNDIEDKYVWYVETSTRYQEADGIEKEYLEMTDVMTYNLWYTDNKADLENPWSFKNAAGCEFDYIY